VVCILLFLAADAAFAAHLRVRTGFGDSDTASGRGQAEPRAGRRPAAGGGAQELGCKAEEGLLVCRARKSWS